MCLPLSYNFTRRVVFCCLVEAAGIDRMLRRFFNFVACILPARRPHRSARSSRLRLSKAEMYYQYISTTNIHLEQWPRFGSLSGSLPSS